MEVRQASLRPDLNGAVLCLPKGPRPAIHSFIYPILSLLILLLEVTGASSQHQTHDSRTGDKYSLIPLMGNYTVWLSVVSQVDISNCPKVSGDTSADVALVSPGGELMYSAQDSLKKGGFFSQRSL